MDWKTIDSAPRDGTLHIRGLYVRGPKSHGVEWTWEVCVGYIDDNGDFIDQDDSYIGWEADDYEYWMPLPSPPEPPK
jgi:hypothetical protein